MPQNQDSGMGKAVVTGVVSGATKAALTTPAGQVAAGVGLALVACAAAGALVGNGVVWLFEELFE